MGPAQVMAWLGTLLLAFLALTMALLAYYRTEALQRRVQKIEDEGQARQTELMVEIRDLLRERQGQRPAAGDTGIHYYYEPDTESSPRTDSE
jgi:hypothetical protein